ncbi:MAG TPA: Rieske (2Fe-2S) protein [Stellaceae bacterium]|nr:Rieske (2Fe-2S) protein [Stellaceae bacterium]
MTIATACRFDELADGTAKRVMMGQRRIALVRVGSRVFACIDSCPHKGGYLSEGWVSAARQEVICPWHRFRFKLESGASATNPELVVETFPARVENGEIVVELP